MMRLMHLTKSFGKRTLFSNLSYSFPSAGLFQISGDNGCGKTTLLYMIALLDTEFKGSIDFDGAPVNAQTPEKQRTALRLENISYVFPNKNFVSYQTIRESFLEQGLDTKRAEAITGIDRLPSTMSGGELLLFALEKERQKKKRIILLDEVTSQLDANHCKSAMDTLEELAKDALVISVTHDSRTRGHGRELILTKEGMKNAGN